MKCRICGVEIKYKSFVSHYIESRYTKREAVCLKCEKKYRKMCEECGKYPADWPSKLCAGCNAYKEHTGGY